MSIETIAIRKAVDDAFSRLGEDIIYTADGEDAVTIAAIVNRGGNHQEPYIRGTVNATCSIQVKRNEVPNIKRGDTFTVDNEIWEVDPKEGVTHISRYTTVIEAERSLGQ